MRRLRIGTPPNDKILRIRDEGESKRPPLVCVHGAGGSSVMWMDVVRRLSPLRRVVAPDLPGHGQSQPWNPPDDVSIDMFRDAVGTVCAELKIDRAILVGHSMGTLVCLAAAAAWPERVAGLVLVNGGARIPVAPPVLVALSDDYTRFGKWMARSAWSPSTPL